jgi:2-polyprenyl-6-methoxyphenol hydroxylase-like FAD-dependent oxidoreductase
LLIAADGQNSRTRNIIFAGEPGMSKDEVIKHTGQSMAFYTIPRGPTDSDYARWYNAPGRRNIFTRPDNRGTTRVLAGVVRDNDERVKNVMELSVEEQKALVKEIFADAGWEAERLLGFIDDADDFYMQSIVQIKAPRWSKGRATLLGDAAYCPSPITGMGTTVALCGAYILAGELSKSPDDIEAALEQYEKVYRPVVDKFQKLLPGAPKIMAPETGWGLKFFQMTIQFVANSGLGRVLQSVAHLMSEDPWRLPEYPAFEN